MNIQNHELLRQHAEHVERQRRFAVAMRPAPIIEKPEKYTRYMVPQEPLWMREEIRFDAHCENWMIERTMSGTPLAYLKRRAAWFGIPYPLMIGAGRLTEISHRRQLLMWEMMREFGMSFPQIGRMFGGRDHTTALHAYRKIDAMTDAERAHINTPVVPVRRVRR